MCNMEQQWTKLGPRSNTLVMSKFVAVSVSFGHYEIIDGAWMVR